MMMRFERWKLAEGRATKMVAVALLVASTVACDTGQDEVSLVSSVSTSATASTDPERVPPEAVDPAARVESLDDKLTVVDEQGSRTRHLGALLAGHEVRRIATMDPYYRKKKTFRAVSLRDVLFDLWPDLRSLSAGPDSVGPGGAEEPSFEIQLQAKDGYAARLSPALALDPSAYLAFADAEHPRFEPIGDRGADPAPLYLIWEGESFQDLEKHPRPWAIVQVKRIQSGLGLDRLLPRGGFGSNESAARGHAIFSRECVRCHSINQQGGKLGPDLNVPLNVLEYRPIEQVRAYIKNPQTFRYSAMPPHPQLSEQNLDELMDYFRIMKDSKIDPHQETGQQGGH